MALQLSNYLTPEEQQLMLGSTYNPSQKKAATKKTTKPVSEDDLRSKLLGLLPMAGGVVGSLAGSVVPGAGTLVGGAAGSAGGEFLRQRLSGEDVNVGKVAGEGAMGLAGGVVGKVGGKALSAVGKLATKQAPERMMNSVLRENMRSTEASIKNGTKTLGKQALDRGIKGGSPESMFDDATTKLNNLEDQLQATLTKSSGTVPVSDIEEAMAPLMKKYTQAGNQQAADGIGSRIAALRQANGGDIPLAKANEIKRTLYDEARNSYGKLSGEAMEGTKGIARALKEGIAKAAPEVSSLNEELAFNGRVVDSLATKMSREGRNDVMGLKGSVLSAGAAAATGGLSALPALAENAIGSTAVKTMGANALVKAGQVGANVAGSAGGQLTGATVAQGLPRIGQMGSEAVAAGPQTMNPAQSMTAAAPEAEQPMLSPGGQWRWDAASNDWVANEQAAGAGQMGGATDTSGDAQKIYQAMVQDFQATGGKNFTKLSGLLDANQSINKESAAKEDKVTEAEYARQELNGLVDEAITQLQTGAPKTGPIGSRVEDFKSKFNQGDPATLAFNTTISSLKASITKARAGASLTEGEKKMLDSYTPTVGDSTQVLATKLATLKQIAGRMAGVQTQPNTLPEIPQTATGLPSIGGF